MKLILFSHPSFLGQQSMPRFVQMLQKGFTARGYQVEVLQPEPMFHKLSLPQGFKKWLGYIDQYLVFPLQAKRHIRKADRDTLFVFTDQALGPWVPLVPAGKSVIHCHDFLAQRSALGEFSQNPTSFTGRLYQKYIRKGYQKGENFISVSCKTQQDLHKFLGRTPATSKVVYNGFNQLCKAMEAGKARANMSKWLSRDVSDGYFMHVGGNDWYKNKTGVIDMYNAWRKRPGNGQPLVLIGHPPQGSVLETYQDSPYLEDIFILSGWPDEKVQTAYSGATALLFPSLAEGFGWPVAEAMACGCPVITTNEAPMTEVAGGAAYLLPAQPYDIQENAAWLKEAADVMDAVSQLSPQARDLVVKKGFENASRFNTEDALDKIEAIYRSVLYGKQSTPATQLKKQGKSKAVQP